MFVSRKCFNCGKKIKTKNDLYQITMNTLEGKHNVKVCGTCADQFDKILKDIEDIQSERPNPL